MLEKIFKVGLLILGVILLLLYYQNMQNGRFQYIHPDDDSIHFEMLDTKTGIAYMLGRSDGEKDQPLEWIVIDPLKGTVTRKESSER